jgi:YYY domain-containing protein
LTILLYLPYLRRYVTGYNTIELWRGGRTPLNLYLWIYAVLLLPVVTRLVIEAAEGARRSSRFRLTLAVSFVGALFVGVGLAVLGYPVALLAVPIGGLAAVVFFMPGRSGEEALDAGERLQWLAVGAAMALSVAVEVVVLQGDIGRMNTVFKFYLQVWILLSIAAATSLTWVWRRARRWRTSLRELWLGTMGLLIAGGALFLPFGIRARAVDRMAPATGLTLDGMAFTEHAVISDGREGNMQEISLTGDYHAIRWMQETIEGSPVILEGLGRHEYLWANRVSIYTGLPAVVGWEWHQVQQRAGLGGDLVHRRRADVNAFYNTTDIAQAEEILARYGVGYVYVGGYERAYYDQQGLGKLDRMVEEGVLRTAYEAHGVTVYEVVSQRGY